MWHLPICPGPHSALASARRQKKEQAGNDSKRNERHQQHSGGHHSPATLFLAGYRYLDATFCVPCEFVRKRGHIAIVHGNLHLVDVKKIQRDIDQDDGGYNLSLIHISEPTRQAEISYAVFCLKKKK